jgi:hypothetical protein
VTAELEELLSQLDPRFIQMHNQAWEILRTDNLERGRLAAHEIRELLNQLLHHLAPNDKVLARPEYKGLNRKDITRKVRVKCILGGSQSSNTHVGIIEHLAKLADEMYGVLSGRAHRHDEVDVAEVAGLIQITETIIIRILESRVE